MLYKNLAASRSRNTTSGNLAALASQVGSAFRSRLVAADFARLSKGDWYFIEAGPGSCAGTDVRVLERYDDNRRDLGGDVAKQVAASVPGENLSI